jgi:hypothetical protein
MFFRLRRAQKGPFKENARWPGPTGITSRAAFGTLPIDATTAGLELVLIRKPHCKLLRFLPGRPSVIPVQMI